MIQFDFRGSNVLVTGGVVGIGEGISSAFLKAGARVFATTRKDIQNKEVDQFLKKYEKIGEIKVIQSNLEGGADIEKLQNQLINLDAKINILINNAGHTQNVTDPFCNLNDWESVFALNFFSPVELCRVLMPMLKKASFARIVNITSCAGLENSGPVTFSAAKAALTAYTRSMGRVLAIESPYVVMSAAYPGVIETRGGHWENVRKTNPERVAQYTKERCPLGRFGEIDEFVPLVLFLSSRENSFGHGAIMGLDGGQSKHYNYFNYLD